MLGDDNLLQRSTVTQEQASDRGEKADSDQDTQYGGKNGCADGGRARTGLAFMAISLLSCFGWERSGAAGTYFPAREVLQSFSRLKHPERCSESSGGGVNSRQSLPSTTTPAVLP